MSSPATSASQAALTTARADFPHAPEGGKVRPEPLVPLALDALQDVQDAVNHRDPRTTQRYNRHRRRHETHPGHTLAARLVDRLPE